jgi:hypothetical protein
MRKFISSLFRILALSIFAYLPFFSVAQIAVGNCNSLYNGTGITELLPGEREKLMNSTMVFIHRKNEDKAIYERIFTDVWKICKFKIMSLEEKRNSKFDDNTSFLCIESSEFITDQSILNHYISLVLSMPSQTKKGKPETRVFARIELNGARTKNPKFEKDIEKYYYEEEEFYNWNYGFIKTYLININERLMSKKDHELYVTESSPNISPLKTQTLYIPDYALVDFDSKKKHDPAKFLSDYEFKYQVVTNEELSELILSSGGPVYYFVYVKNQYYNYATIFNSQSGEMLYTNWKRGLTLKPGEFKDISKAIKKT